MPLDFGFKLTTVLALRERTKEAKLKAYARIVQQKMNLTESLKKTRLELKQLIYNQEQINQLVNPQQYIQLRNKVNELHSQVEDLQRHIQSLEIEESKRLNEFLEAKRNVEILEKLKEKKMQQFLHTQSMLSEKLIDDWSQFNAGQKK